MRWIAYFSTHVVTHSSEGVIYFQQKYTKANPKKIRYIPHPIYSYKIKYQKVETIWDIIIWGGISRYKNILSFLNYIQKDEFFSSKRILICGRCADDIYAREIINTKTENVEFINKFISDKELDYYINHSKTVLFTYSDKSILSSGALIFSLNYLKPIFGPNAGAFKDLNKIVQCYNSFEEIKHFDFEKSNNEAIRCYLKNNTWENFAKVIVNL